MSVARTNLLNIALMLVSAAVAWFLPFETFLFVYAVLGPLHYLTEISWLHDRGWFATGRHDWIATVLPCVPLTALYIGEVHGDMSNVVKAMLTWLAVAMAAGAVVRGSLDRKLLVAAGVFAAGAVLAAAEPAQIAISVLLPTLIHVFVFTALFIAVGALKARSASGWCSLALHLAIPAALIAWGTTAPGYAPAPGAFDKSKPFHMVAVLLMNGVHAGGITTTAFTVGMQCLAYAYTYHYLNWFSKTQIIGWYQISRRRLTLILALWAASVAIYYIDYEVGISALFALSLAHVFLEFPLNIRSLGTLAASLRGRRLHTAAAE